MAAYLVGHVSVKDEKLWRQYVNGVQDSLTGYESRVIFRGDLVSVLAGKHEHTRAVVIEFSDHSILDDWFQSEKYQSLISLRNKAADVVIMSYAA